MDPRGAPGGLPDPKQLQGLDDDRYRAALCNLLEHPPGGSIYVLASWFEEVFAGTRARKLLATTAEAVLVARRVSQIYDVLGYRRWPARPFELILSAALDSPGAGLLADAAAEILAKCATHLPDRPYRWLLRLAAIDPGKADAVLDAWTSTGAPIAGQIRSSREQLGPVDAQGLLLHLLGARTPKPGKSWLAAWTLLRSRISSGKASPLLLALADAGHVRTIEEDDPSGFISRGALWALADYGDGPVRDALGETILAWSRSGAGSPALGSAAVSTLGRMADDDALRRLLALRSKIQHRNLQTRLDEAIGILATLRGSTPAAIADTMVPDHGLDVDRQRTWHLGDWTVTLRLDSKGAVVRESTAPDGRQRSVPATVKKQHEAAWKAVAAEERALKATLTPQRHRLEVAMVEGRSWEVEEWSTTFGRHPLLSNLAGRIVWQLEGKVPTLAIPKGGQWKASTDQAVLPPPGTRISLPHPLTVSSEVLLAWQRAITSQGIIQPFKQMFRETYQLTPLEREMGGESDRFAGFPVALAQLYALTKARGWSGSLGLSGFDGAGEGTRTFPAHGIRAHLRHTGFTQHLALLETLFFERQLPGAGRRPQWERMPLVDVPPLVFSEAVRDIDLIVSVSVLSTEAQWAEWERLQRAAGRSWSSMPDAYMDLLHESAVQRGQLLRQLVADVGLAGSVHIENDAAIVQGQRGRYRIHLGSGLVFIDRPGSAMPRMLSIRLEALKQPEYLPYEEDDPKTVEILNKIFLLSNDAAIADRRILEQLEASA